MVVGRVEQVTTYVAITAHNRILGFVASHKYRESNNKNPRASGANLNPHSSPHEHQAEPRSAQQEVKKKGN